MHSALLVVDVQHGLFGGPDAAIARINSLVGCSVQQLVICGCACECCVDTTARRTAAA